MFEVMSAKFFCFSVLFFLCLSCICLGGGGFVLSTMTHRLKGMHWDSLLQVDSITIFIILMLGICFGYAYFYTGHYFSNDVSGNQLNGVISIFVAVMASLVLTGDFLTTLVFWEYLGVVRFFLILFYMKYLSLRASVVTLVSSRFGDVCLFLVIAVTLYTGLNGPRMMVLLFFIIFSHML